MNISENKNTENSQDENKVACGVCLKEIPSSEAKSAEASDYVSHFCGLDCYDVWMKQQEENVD